MVFKKIIATLTLLCFLICLQGCYSNRLIPPEEVEQYPDYRIVKVVTVDGEVIEFETGDVMKTVVKDNHVEGLSKDGSYKWVPLSQVKMAYVRKPDHAKTALFLTFITASVVLLIIGLAAFAESMESVGLGD